MRLIEAYPGTPGPQVSQTYGVGRNLLASLERLARLEYLSAVALDHPGAPLLAVSTVLGLKEEVFNARYPSFPAWLAANAERLERNNAPMKLKGTVAKDSSEGKGSGAGGGGTPQ